MEKLRNHFTKFYLLLVLIAPLTPRFSSADKTITHWITLTLAAGLGLILTLVYKNKQKFVKDYFFYPVYFYFSFVIIAVFSSFFAINQVESLIAISRIIVILVHIYLFYSLEVYKLLNIKTVALAASSLLLIEIILSINPLYKILPITKYDIAFATEFLLGIEGNKNITSASIITKIPFAIMLFDNSKNKIIKCLAILTIFLGVLNVLFLSARASYLSLFLILIILISYNYFKQMKLFNLDFFRNYKYLILIPFLSYWIYSNSLPEDSKISVDKRYSSIVSYENDNSINDRLRYYSQAIDYAIKNPLMGAGIGNWKIISIKLDGANITSYVVPNVLHNDFLEILGETNFVGMLSYILFFISMLYILFKRLSKTNHLPLYVILSLLAFLVDSSFNFPLYRASMQVNLLIIVIFVLMFHNDTKPSFNYEK